MKIELTEDRYAEQVMKKYGLTWSIESVPMDEIDFVESAKNHARLIEPVQHDHISDLATAILHGDRLPMPVVFKNGSAKRGIIFAGNHRIPAAKECGATSIRCYVISSSDEKVIKTLPSALNAPMRMQNREERLILAIRSVEDGLTTSEASSIYSISESVIKENIQIKELRADFSIRGVNVDGLPKTTILALGRIKNPNVAVPAARLAIAAKLTTPEAELFSQEIRRERTESQQIAVVAAREKALGIDKGIPQVKSKTRTPATMIKMAMGTIEKNLNVRTINQWGITEIHEKDEFVRRGLKFCKAFEAILKRS